MVDEAPKPNNGKGNTMDNGVGVSDVGILAGLYGGIQGGNRGGYGGYGGGHGSTYGNHSAIRADVVANRDIAQIEAINKNATDGFLQSQIAQSNANLIDKVDTEASNRRFADLQSQIGGTSSSLQAEMSRQALAAAECCCENRVGQAEIKAQLTAVLAGQDRAASQHDHDQILQGQAGLQAQINDLNGRDRH